MFQLNYRDTRPIYEQIKEQLRNLIMTGVIKSDEKLPSIREIAASLAINPNTISRAYRELENEGYIYTIPGKGSYSAPVKAIDTRREAELLKQLDKIILELSYIGHTKENLTARINEIIDKGVKNND